MSSIDHVELKRRYERRLQLMVPANTAYLLKLPIFSGIPEKAREKVIDNQLRKYMHVVEYAKGEDVLREGEYSDSAYYIIEGSVEVLVDDRPTSGPGGGRPRVRGGAHVPAADRLGARPDASGMIGRGGSDGTLILAGIPEDVIAGRRTILDTGEVFGELAALSRYPVSATVRAASRLKVLQMRLRGLNTLTKTSKEFKKFLDARYRERMLKRHLRNVSIFSRLDDLFLTGLKDKAELLSFEPGQLIVQEGAPADCFFLVVGGYVKVGVRAGSTELAVTYLRKGDYAGEAALLLDQPWPFTLQALEHVVVIKIGKADFEQILAKYPPVEEDLWRETMARFKTRGSVVRNPNSSEYIQMAMDTGLIHGESVLLIDLNTCTRCDECVRGCADAHEGQTRFIRQGEKYRNWLVPMACYQCTDPVCMMECPTGAITREVNNLEVTINEATCIGCKNCAKRCPWNNIVMVDIDKRADGTEEVATKCDLCLTRPEGPACVQMCPHGSAVRISFKDMERVTAVLK